MEDRPATDDQHLVVAILCKDRKATAEFVCRYADAIYGYVFSRWFRQPDRVDAVSEDIFLAAWENLAGYRGESALESWLMGIARHKVEDYYRARLREPEPSERREEETAEVIPKPDLNDILEREHLHKKTYQV